MKRIFILFAALLLVTPAFSQLFRIGIKAGVQTKDVPTYETLTGTNPIQAIADQSTWGFHGGLFARIKLGPVFLQPEAVFVTNSYDYNVTTGTVPELKSQTFNRLAVPVLLGVKLGPVRLNAGPQATIQIGSPEALIDDPNFDEMYKGALWGYSAGIGIDLFSKLNIDARVSGGLGDMLGDQVTIGSQTFNLDYGSAAIFLSVGWLFGK